MKLLTPQRLTSPQGTFQVTPGVALLGTGPIATLFIQRLGIITRRAPAAWVTSAASCVN